MVSKTVIDKLEMLASHNPKDLAGMARFGINVDKAWVVSIPKLRKLAKEIRKDLSISLDDSERDRQLHSLALEVWKTGIHEARILAGFLDIPDLVTESQMESWVLDFDSWDVVDMVVGNLFDRTEFAIAKAHEWSRRDEEFVKRAGFVLMAGLAVHNKNLPNSHFEDFLSLIEAQSTDPRNFVRKSVNWALRAIGKSRNGALYDKALELSQELELSPDKTARWIGADATRELKKDYIRNRFLK